MKQFLEFSSYLLRISNFTSSKLEKSHRILLLKRNSASHLKTIPLLTEQLIFFLTTCADHIEQTEKITTASCKCPVSYSAG